MTITLELRGREEGRARLPDLFAEVSRSADRAVSDFLPDGYLEPRRSFDVGQAARSAADGEPARRQEAADDEVLVLELADGGTLVTSAARLREALALTHPELVAEGRLDLEQLRRLGAASRGGIGEAVGGLISRVFSFGVGAKADDILLDAAREFGVDRALLGVSWLGTKALMWAVERRLPRGPGLYAWSGGDSLPAQPLAALDARVLAEPRKHPILVFLHGTASHTLGSFGDLREAGRAWWAALEQRFPGGIYGFEHRTLSESPIDNALALLAVLPAGAQVSFVSHSRGGLVGDLLCLDTIADAAINGYRHDLEGTGDADPQEAQRVLGQLADAHGEQRARLRQLAQALAAKGIVVQRYVRVACPAAGTKLASGNFDLFLSGLLSLIGKVPGLFGSPYYAAFKRVVVEIAKNRTNARLVPGIEAMLPDAPLARLLRDAPVRPALGMGVIAGDIEGGGGLLQRLGVLLVDHLLFERSDNDLVVDTPAMLAGIAARAAARVRFDRGADVSHFRYFENADTRDALNDWLQAPDLDGVAAFRALPGPQDYAAALAEAAASRDVGVEDRPMVVVLPGVMGTHLGVGDDPAALDRVWFDPLHIARGGLDEIAWGADKVRAEDLFGMFYGRLCKHLAASHRVERFPYDWRQPLDVLADRLAEFLEARLAISAQPVRLLAHSMGGLVVRACIHKHRDLMDRLMARDGARLVMLGTPNQGAYSMVANLIGKGDTLRTLVRLDLAHSMQEVLDIVAGFRGALQLLPKPGFRDTFQGQSDGGADGWAFQREETWQTLAPKVRDFWFGNGRVGRPGQAVLDEASWLWARDGLERPALPAAYEANSVYVFGVAPNTPCGLREAGGRLKLVGTARGDGTVSWESGRIGGIGGFYYMPAEHGDLPSTDEHFPALAELLATGRTDRLATTPPQVRALEEERPVSYDAGPPATDDADTMQRRMFGAAPGRRVGAAARPQRRLEVAVRAMDLRFVTQPILVGHYDQDPIAGPQALIDSELVYGALSERHRLGMYPGPLGSATAVLHVGRAATDGADRIGGAIVTGLGDYDRPLTPTGLSEAVRAGVLRYLVQTRDLLGGEERELSLATLLIGYNSSANLSVGASVEALVRGVLEANARFRETTRAGIRVRQLDIVELYTDTAITAAYALRQLETRLAADAARLGTQLACGAELLAHESARQRLYDAAGASYWPRIIVTDAERPEEAPAAPTSARLADAARRAVPRTQLPDRLRFVYVGQRARAEVVVQQRQPGLVEKLVRDQIRSTLWQESFGRMLFQLMVPLEFKDAARQLPQVVLVVDSFSANLPWELMLADDPGRAAERPMPLAMRTAVVRQLATGSFRRGVRGSVGAAALVVGNPSLEGFVEAFPGPPERPSQPPEPLPGAEREAKKVREVLTGMGYEVTALIGEDQPAKNVFAALYERPWRIVHVSAHGVFDLRHADGRARSGVLLSGGLLITAAEIAAMEVVPDLVFLNCCHLGKIESDPLRDGNKLAASVARELMDIGVRCVVVAGWAVSDAGAALFGEVFYTELLERGRSFGHAVHAARRALWDADPTDITWGAFQAYGDPGWRARPRDGARGGAGDHHFVSPEELLDALASLRAEVARRADLQNERRRRERIAEVEALLARRARPGWLDRADVRAALGATWRDLQEFGRAREAYLAAIRTDDPGGQAPIRSIEQLANVEARLGQAEGRMELVDAAIDRLETLDRLTASESARDARSVERGALFGSAYKRLAALHAGRRLAEAPTEPAAAAAALRVALERSVAAYRAGAAGAEPDPYPMLNALALQALVAPPRAARERDAAVALAREAGRRALARFRASQSLWDAVMQPEAVLVERLLDRGFAQPDPAGARALDAVAGAYAQALAGVVLKPAELDSVLAHMELLSRIADALSLDADAEQGAALRGDADRLLQLVQRLQPGRPARGDRPAAAAPHAAPPARKTRRKS